MQFFIFLSIFLLTTLISVLFSKLLNDGYRQKTYDQKVDSVVSQCSWLGDQVVGVDFHLDDGSNSLSNQIDELAASMNGRIIVIKNNYKIIKDTHTDFQSRFFLNDNVLDVMDEDKDCIREWKVYRSDGSDRIKSWKAESYPGSCAGDCAI